jgi:hypothetical protein
LVHWELPYQTWDSTTAIPTEPKVLLQSTI